MSHNDYTWSDPVFLFRDNPDNAEILLNEIEKDKVDILGFSMYIWSRKKILELTKIIKKKFPNLLIVIGGPEVDAHINPIFFLENKQIDYCIYGDGEESFSTLLDYIAEYDVNPVNLVTNKNKIYSHTVFQDRQVLNISPYINYQSEIKAHLNKVHDDLRLYNQKLNINLSHQQTWRRITLVWETTKGCPYSCTFCDWNSGLHNKVRIWGDKSAEIPHWQTEIDLFFEWNLYHVNWTNANIGLTPQDKDIVEYWCQKRIANNSQGPKLYTPQWSKLKKDVVFDLLDKMLSAGVTDFFKADLQDLDPIVLENIDRPEVPWEIHQEFIKKLLKKHKISSNANWQYRLNFIWGLPGQTLNNMKTNLIEAGKLNLYAHHMPFELIPLSPAAKPEYQKKFDLKISTITIVGNADAFKNQSRNKNWTIERAVVGTSTLSNKEWFIGLFLYYVYIAFSSAMNIHGQESNIIDRHKAIDNIILDSFEYFKENSRVAAIDYGKEKSIYHYVMDNYERLYNIFFT